MATLAFSETIPDEIIRKACEKAGFVSNDISKCKTFLANYTNLSKLQNWEQMNISTAMGSSIVQYGGIGSMFDGRYIYYAAWESNTFLRYDTSKSFTDANSWERMSRSTAYAVSLAAGSSASTMIGAFDGRYMYISPNSADTFLRYDTTLSFTAEASWGKISISTATKAAPLDSQFGASCFDGRYVYFGMEKCDTFIRFDTTLSFTNSSAWEIMSASTACKRAVADYEVSSPTFDGRFVYFPASAGDFQLRFDTTLVFTNSSAWENMSLSTIAGTSTIDGGTFCEFDGVYVWYSSSPFMKFDTSRRFTDSTAWQIMSRSTAAGTSVCSYGIGVKFDGKYVYFSPWDVSLMYLRVLACPKT